MIDKVIKDAAAGSKRSLARIITWVENRSPEAPMILKEIYGKSGNEFSVGITGAPGAGKSTLIGALTEVLLGRGFRLGIIAIDPTSPITGGAILGDRVRFMDLSGRDAVYIRSMGSRGYRGGINRALIDVVRVLGAFGYDFVIIETVGTGQNEVDISMAADLTTLVMVPEGGDEIQLLKSGSTEMADVFLVNKTDHVGADILISRLRDLQQLRGAKSEVFGTIAKSGEGIEAFAGFLQKQHQSFRKERRWIPRRKKRLRWEIANLMEYEIADRLRKLLDQNQDCLDSLVEKIIADHSSPYVAVDEFSRDIVNGFENRLTGNRIAGKT